MVRVAVVAWIGLYLTGHLVRAEAPMASGNVTRSRIITRTETLKRFVFGTLL